MKREAWWQIEVLAYKISHLAIKCMMAYQDSCPHHRFQFRCRHQGIPHHELQQHLLILSLLKTQFRSSLNILNFPMHPKYSSLLGRLKCKITKCIINANDIILLPTWTTLYIAWSFFACSSRAILMLVLSFYFLCPFSAFCPSSTLNRTLIPRIPLIPFTVI